MDNHILGEADSIRTSKILASDLFDEVFYREQVTEDSVSSPLEHYCETGWRLGLDPSPTFSTRAYLEDHPDVRNLDTNPFRHYIDHGQFENRSIKPSARLSSAVRILVASKEVDTAVAMLLERAFCPIHAQALHPTEATSLAGYLEHSWREIESPRFGAWRRQPRRGAEWQISKAERKRILEAAQSYTSNRDLCAALNAMVDIAFYSERCEAVGIMTHAELNLDVVMHYLAVGRHFRISITPLFDIAYYVEAATKVKSQVVDPANAIIDYFSNGEAKGLRPCSFFNPDYYGSRYGADVGSPLVHYVVHGAELDYQPCAAFWNNWYRKSHRIGDINPLVHFYRFGIRERLSPNPIFNLSWYARLVDLPSEENPLQHYVTKGFLNDVSPAPLVDVSYIGQQVAASGIHQQAGETVVELYLRMACELNPHPLFDTAYYLRRHEDGNTITHPLAHYLETSVAEPKFPNPYFSDQVYYDARPDVLRSRVNALVHYVCSGYREDVRVHPLVDHGYLRRTLLNLNGITPLAAAITNRVGSTVRMRAVSEHPDCANKSKWLPVALNIERAAERYPKVRPSRIKIGILAHVFYVDLLPEVIAFAHNVPKSSSLLVTTDTSAKRQDITLALKESGLTGWEVRLHENRGRDIAPSFIGFADRLPSLDYCVHIHTKRSHHYDQPFDQWRRYLFAENGGTRARVDAILRVFEANNTLGALAPVDFAPIRQFISWGYDRSMVEALLLLAGRRDSLDDVSLEFPSGSMFWFRTKALAGLFEAGLERYHFDAEEGQVDGTLAHAIERAFFMLIETEGYDWARFCSSGRLGGYKITNDIKFARSHLLPSRKMTDAIMVKLPETAPFYCRAVDNDRQRLNLLIPTCDLQVGYAGVSEAIRQFRAIGDRLGTNTDLRIIATDTPFNNMTVPPQDFTIFSSLIEDSDLAVVPGYLRRQQPLGLRRNDYFVASAWWNAKQALELIDAQSSIYNGTNNRRMVYLIQDFEPGFSAWSTRWALAESTYRHPKQTIAVFNTPFLSEFMSARYEFSTKMTYYPGINGELLIPLEDQLTNGGREKIMLLYARMQAERNCIEMIDAVVSHCVEQDPNFWSEWRFLAIGETFKPALLQCRAIEVLGRLSLPAYREYLAKSRLGLSIMISPHPSYPPLEMAGAGIRVLTNIYENKDLSKLHENIESFQAFDPPTIARQLRLMAKETNVPGKPLADWFFGGRSNLHEIAEAVAHEIQSELGVSGPLQPEKAV